MKDKIFIDTNVFVYSFDAKNAKKQKTAQALIARALDRRDAIVSTQVIQEFLNVATKKFATPLKPEDCQSYMEKIFSPLCEIFSSLDLYADALTVRRNTGYSFYDALIVASALRGGCTKLYSEDLQDGRKIQGLAIVNPFA